MQIIIVKLGDKFTLPPESEQNSYRTGYAYIEIIFVSVKEIQYRYFTSDNISPHGTTGFRRLATFISDIQAGLITKCA